MRPPDDRSRLIDALLAELASQLAQTEHPGSNGQGNDTENEANGYEEGWPLRQILVATLAEVSEHLTYRAFTRSHDLQEVIDLLVRAARDPGSYNARRFAIRALGNLQRFTADVANVFFAACQDVGEVYSETRRAVGKFKEFAPGSLLKLTAAVQSPSSVVAHHAAILLGALGMSRSEELGRQGRKLIADELVGILEDPIAERIVYDFRSGSAAQRVGPLYDVIYDTLVRVVDPDTSLATLESESNA